MNYIKVTLAVADPLRQDIFIALLSDLGYDGFEQQDNALLAFLGEDRYDATALEAAIRPFDPAYTTTLLPEQNWNKEWERNFTPVQVDEFCAVRAHFHPPMTNVVHELIITPKMSFGTGHHATTYMMLQTMQFMDFNEKSVLDFGTGTGVLAILAERLGASTVIALDNDDWSIENARENIRENHCVKISVEKSDSPPKGRAFDIILANINKHILLREMAGIGQQLKEGGVILMSGLLQDDCKDIENQALKSNLSITTRTSKGGWICLKMEKSPN